MQPSAHKVVHSVVAAGNTAEHLPNERFLLVARHCFEAEISDILSVLCLGAAAGATAIATAAVRAQVRDLLVCRRKVPDNRGPWLQLVENSGGCRCCCCCCCCWGGPQTAASPTFR
eukprot:GHRQ01014115.1.p1 GENE.GHRQ01014115.1~~GHRQ01014115.1.p1  ORF type:complete len:116 (-),score=16.35 GHRQ01014115.1:932-1279(-)